MANLTFDRLINNKIFTRLTWLRFFGFEFWMVGFTPFFIGYVISSRELSKSELDRISKDLSDTMGSTLKFDYKVDKDLIGGLKLQLGSFMIDTSIKNKLKKYEQMMIEN